MSTPSLPTYNAPFLPVPQVTPFTYRDGVTMLKRLELLVKYVNRELVPFVNDNYADLAQAFEDQVNLLIIAVNAAIDQIINDSIEVQDAVVAGIVEDTDSETRIALNGIYATDAEFTSAINSVNSAIAEINTEIDKLNRHVVNVVTPEEFGAAGDGVANDSTAFASALSAIAGGGTIQLRPSARYKIDVPLTIEARLHKIVGGPNTVIDASGFTGGTVITVHGDEPYPPHKSNDTILTGFDIAGPGKSSLVTGITFTSPGPDTDNAVHNIAYSDINIKDCGIGVTYFTNSYNITATNIAFYTCGIGANQPSGGLNYGERILFIGSTFTACDVAVKMANENGNFNFTNCSFDYNEASILSQQDGRVSFDSCHFEYRDTTTAPAFVVSGSEYTMLHVFGGNLHVAGSTPAATRGFDAIVNHTSLGSVLFDSVFIVNAATKTDYFAIGDGLTRAINTFVPSNSPSMPKGFADSTSKLPSSRLKDNAGVVDPWYVTNDSAISSRLNGTNIDVESSNVKFRTGTRSVRINKATAVGSIGRATIFIPVEEGQSISWNFWYSAVSAGSGTIYVEPSWANCVEFKSVDAGGNGSTYQILGEPWPTFAVNKTGGIDIPWTSFNSGNSLKKVPGGVTHLAIKINVDNIGASQVYFDDMIVSQW